jgi:hypothetical protein
MIERPVQAAKLLEYVVICRVETADMPSSNSQFKQFIRLSFILAGLHAAAMVVTFLVFGLGLEGPQTAG